MVLMSLFSTRESAMLPEVGMWLAPAWHTHLLGPEPSTSFRCHIFQPTSWWLGKAGPAVGHELLDTPEALSQRPINHRCFYSPGRAQEGVGTRFLAGTHNSFPPEPVPSFTDSSMQLAESTWTEGEFGSEAGEDACQVSAGFPALYSP